MAVADIIRAASATPFGKTEFCIHNRRMSGGGYSSASKYSRALHFEDSVF